MSAENFDDFGDDLFFEDDATSPPPPPPTFEQQAAHAAEYGVTVTALTAYYPEVVASRFTCPRCTRTVRVRAPKAEWQLANALARIVSAHPKALCEQIRREATAHVQWGLEYGGADTVQRQDSEQRARDWAAECARDPAGDDGYRGPVVVYREVGPWRIAPAPTSPAP